MLKWHAVGAQPTWLQQDGLFFKNNMDRGTMDTIYSKFVRKTAT